MSQFGLATNDVLPAIVGWCLLLAAAAVLVGALTAWFAVRRLRRASAAWTATHRWRVRFARAAALAGAFILPVMVSVAGGIGFAVSQVVASAYERGDPATVAWFIDSATRQGEAALRLEDQDAPIDVGRLWRHVPNTGPGSAPVFAWEQSLRTVLDEPRDRRMTYRALIQRVRGDVALHARSSLSFLGRMHRTLSVTMLALAGSLVVISNAVALILSIVLIRPVKDA